MKRKIAAGITGILLFSMAYGSSADLIEGYRGAGAGPFSATAGRAAWVQEHRPSSGGDVRNCAVCHGTNLKKPGRHVKTGKRIEPMAVSVNSSRLSDPKKVEKWFGRNCRWTLGRDCTPEEKGSFIQFISNQ